MTARFAAVTGRCGCAAALAPSGLSPCGSQAKPPVANAGPSERFLSLTRKPGLTTAWPFVPTVKNEGDVVL